jgi:hypothetical protein
MTDDAFSDAAPTRTTMLDGMGKYELKEKNTFLDFEEGAEVPTSLELRRGVSEPAPKVAVEEEEAEEEELDDDLLPPPQLDRLQTSENWEPIPDWQCLPEILRDVWDPKMPCDSAVGAAEAELRRQLYVPGPGPSQWGLAQAGDQQSEARAQQPTGGQVYFPVPGVMPPSFPQNQPMQLMGQMQTPTGQKNMLMVQQPMQGMQPMQPNVPVVMQAGWRPPRGNEVYASGYPFGGDRPEAIRQQGGPCHFGTSPRPVNPDFGAAEAVGAPLPVPEVPVAEALPAPEPVGLRQEFSNDSKIHRVIWTQPNKFLRSTNKNAVSPPFQICGADFKLVLAADASDKGNASFKQSKGRCSMKLKCERISEGTTALTIMFRFFVGDMPVRGPAMHDFKNGTALAGLKRNDEPWDLLTQVKDMTVTVGVELWEV